MTKAAFALIPFPAAKIPEIQIGGWIDRGNNILSIHYSMTGRVEQILFPPVSSHPTRKHDLWKATCFEFFLAFPNDSQYWEFNMSPSGDWNVYHMDAYRRVGFRDEILILQLPFSFHCEPDAVAVEATVDLSPILPVDRRLQVGITSVVESKHRHKTYWALSHPDSQADFHLRESFVSTLPA